MRGLFWRGVCGLLKISNPLIFSFYDDRKNFHTVEELIGETWYYDTSSSGDKMQRGKVLCREVVMLSMVNTGWQVR